MPASLQAQETNTAEIIRQFQLRVEELERKVRVLESEAEARRGATNAANDGRIEELDQKVKVLERQRELDQESSEEAAKQAARTMPVITAGANGFIFRSADTNFVVALHGVLQLDSRQYYQEGANKAGNDQFLPRRARPILEGTVFRDFDFVFVPDFGGSSVQIFDAYLNYRLMPEFQLEAGKFKVPIGLEHLQADRDITFNERSLATDLVPNRDLGVQLHGDAMGGVISYAAGIFNSAPDYTSTTTNSAYDDNKAFAGRVFLQPFKNTSFTRLQRFGFGVAGSYEVDRAGTNTSSNGLTPGYTTDGQQKFFSYSPTNGTVFANGTHWRVAPQGYYYYGPMSLMGEYVFSDQDVSSTSKRKTADLLNTAWEVTGGVVLTGEDATYNSVTPAHPFDPLNGHWGALQLVGRYAELNIDKKAFPLFSDLQTSAEAADAWSVGLNWFLNRNVRFDLSFSKTSFEGGSKGSVTKQPEDVIFTRIQLAF